jgi:CheY-like chemotaxis protein
MSEPLPPSRFPDQALQALAVATHEVRGGLAGIIAHARLLEDPSLSDDRRAATIQVIERNGVHLLDLFDRVLQSARVDAGSDPIIAEQGDLREVVADSVGLFHAAAAERGVQLEYHVASDVPASISFDPQALRRVLGNLLGNAVKFTSDGSIRVAVHYDARHSIRIEVADTGCGIAASDHERIFEPFERGGHCAAAASGVGLGLALCRRLMAMMSGTLTVESDHGAGSTFRIQWPHQHQPPEVDPAGLCGTHVLLVDDCADTRALLEHVLVGYGVRVSSVADGHQAIDRMRDGGFDRAFDAVLVDIEMPEMNGWETTAAIRQIGFEGPVIAVSAHDSRAHHERAGRAGCTACISKPITPESLAHTLLSHLQDCSARLAG